MPASPSSRRSFRRGRPRSGDGPKGDRGETLMTTPPSVPPTPAVSWYRGTLVGMEVGPTGAQSGVDPEDAEYASRFSGREIVEAAVAANAEYLVIWAKDGEFAYYDSHIAPKAPG